MHVSRDESAKRFNGIYKLYYKDLKLYAGCERNISIWDFDINSQRFQYRGDIPIDKKYGPAIAFDSLNDNLFYGQVGGNIAAIKTVEGYPSSGGTTIGKDVTHFSP
jgi:hypothetical protein